MKTTKIVFVLLCSVFISIGILVSADSFSYCDDLYPLTGYWEGTYIGDTLGQNPLSIGLGIDVNPEGKIRGVIAIYNLGNYGRYTYHVEGSIKDNKIEFFYEETGVEYKYTGTIKDLEIEGSWQNSKGKSGFFQLIRYTKCPNKLSNLTGYWEGTYTWTSPGWSATWPFGLGVDISSDGEITGVLGIYTKGDSGDWGHKVTGTVEGNKITFVYGGAANILIFTGTVDEFHIEGKFKRSDGQYGIFKMDKYQNIPVKPELLTGYWEGTYRWTDGWTDIWPIGLGIEVSPQGRITGVVGVYTKGNYGEWSYKVTGKIEGDKVEFSYKGTTHNHLFKGTIVDSKIKGTFERSDGHYGIFEISKYTNQPVNLQRLTGYWEGSYNWDSIGDDTLSIGLGIDINQTGNVKGVIGIYTLGYYGLSASKVNGSMSNDFVQFTYQEGKYSYTFKGTIAETTITGTWRRSDNNYGTFQITKYFQYKRFIPDDYPVSHPNTLFFNNFNDGNLDGWTYSATKCYSFGGSAILKGRYANNSYLRCNKEFDWKKPFRIDVSLKFIDLIHPPLACMGVRFFKADVPDGGKYVGVYIRSEPSDSGANPYGKIVEIYRQDKDYNTVSFNWNEQWFYNLTFIVRDGVVYVYVKKEDVNSISDKPMLIGKIDINTPGYGNRFDLFTYSASAEFDYVIVSKLENKTIYVPKDYPTIQDAVNNADYGDSIVVAEGKYAGAVLRDGIKLTGAGADKTKIAGIISAGNNCSIENLAVLGGGYIRIEKNIKDVVIRRLLLNGCGYGILACGNNTFIAENNTIVNHGYIDKIGKPQGAGIYYQQYSNVVIQNNIIANNPGYGIVTWWRNSTDKCEYNDVYNNGLDYVIAKPGEGSISKDPLFKDEANGDYHLTKNSLCRDSGNPDEKYNDPDGTRNDMGVFPYKTPNVKVAITKIPDKVLKNHKYTVEWKIEGDFKKVEQTEILWGLVSGEYTHSGTSYNGEGKEFKDELQAPKMKEEKESFFIYLTAHALVSGEDFYSEEKKIEVIHDNGKDEQKSAVTALTSNLVECIGKPMQITKGQIEEKTDKKEESKKQVQQSSAKSVIQTVPQIMKNIDSNVIANPAVIGVKQSCSYSKKSLVSRLYRNFLFKVPLTSILSPLGRGKGEGLSSNIAGVKLAEKPQFKILYLKVLPLQFDRCIRYCKDSSYIKFGDIEFPETFKFYKPWEEKEESEEK